MVTGANKEACTPVVPADVPAELCAPASGHGAASATHALPSLPAQLLAACVAGAAEPALALVAVVQHRGQGRLALICVVSLHPGVESWQTCSVCVAVHAHGLRSMGCCVAVSRAAQSLPAVSC